MRNRLEPSPALERGTLPPAPGKWQNQEGWGGRRIPGHGPALLNCAGSQAQPRLGLGRMLYGVLGGLRWGAEVCNEPVGPWELGGT